MCMLKSTQQVGIECNLKGLQVFYAPVTSLIS
jgi:hypothetical protein